MRIMAALLVVGFICNALIRPVDARFAEQRDAIADQPSALSLTETAEREVARAGTGAAGARLVAAWAFVGVPLMWGVLQVFKKSLDLFR
jgi:hypothetical protein